MTETDQVRCCQEILHVKLQLHFCHLLVIFYLLVFGLFKILSLCNELRLIRILKSELRRRSIFASVVLIIPFLHFFVFELRSIRILKNEISRWSMLTSIDFFINFFLLLTFEGELCVRTGNKQV